MKKLVAVILLLALIVPAAALADRDPIVGSYYSVFDYTLYPEMATSSGGFDIMLMILTFYEDGTIMSTENDIVGKTGTQHFGALGKWEKTDTGYNISLIGLGEGEIIIEENSILVPIQTMGHLRMYKMMILNPYKDYVLNY